MWLTEPQNDFVQKIVCATQHWNKRRQICFKSFKDYTRGGFKFRLKCPFLFQKSSYKVTKILEADNSKLVISNFVFVNKTINTNVKKLDKGGKF